MALVKFVTVAISILIGTWILGVFPHLTVGATSVAIVLLFLLFKD